MVSNGEEGFDYESPTSTSHDSSYDTFYYTKAAVLIPNITGSISAFFSLIILSVIIRSERKLSFCYHRIMFFMSFWDVIGSIAVALTTIPMPRDVYELYPFQGGAYGTASTCRMQGFLVVLSNFFVFCTGVALNIYYLCEIRFAISEQTCRKWLEPLLLLVVCTVTLVPSLMFLEEDMYNPTPFSPFCSLGPYPWDRDTSLEPYYQIKKVFLSGTVLGLVIVIVTMILIVDSVYKSERRMEGNRIIQRTSAVSTTLELTETGIRQTVQEIEIPTSSASHIPTSTLTTTQERDGDGNDAQDSEQNQSGEAVRATSTNTPRSRPNANMSVISSVSRHRSPYNSRRKNTRIIMFQAMLYLGAFFLTHTFVFLTFLIEETWYIQMLRLVFSPLQGFFNALIFIYHKAYNLQRANNDISFCKAILLSLKSPTTIPDILLSDVVIVAENEFIAGRERIRCYMEAVLRRRRLEAERERERTENNTNDDDDASFGSTSPRMMVELGRRMDLDANNSQEDPLSLDVLSSRSGEDQAVGGRVRERESISSAGNPEFSIGSSMNYGSSASLDLDLDLMSLNRIDEEMEVNQQ